MAGRAITRWQLYLQNVVIVRNNAGMTTATDDKMRLQKLLHFNVILNTCKVKV